MTESRVMSKIYIVKGSSGQYDDYWQWNVIAFSTEQAAQDYIDRQPKVNYEASAELEQLQSEYRSNFYENNSTENFTDEQWETHYEYEESLDMQALKEVQTKYPDADLTLSDDFHGYSIQSVEFGG